MNAYWIYDPLDGKPLEVFHATSEQGALDGFSEQRGYRAKKAVLAVDPTTQTVVAGIPAYLEQSDADTYARYHQIPEWRGVTYLVDDWAWAYSHIPVALNAEQWARDNSARVSRMRAVSSRPELMPLGGM